MIKLAALDMDGTLLDSGKRLPLDFKDWVVNHPDIKTVIASGRQYYTLRDNMGEIADLLTYDAENGSLVFDQGECIYRNIIKKENVLQIIQALKTVDCAPVLCAVNSAYTLHADEITQQQAELYYHHLMYLKRLEDCPELDQTVKFAVYFRNHNSPECYAAIPALPGVKAVVSGPDWIDIANETVNKGTGIRMIREKYGISRGECIGFGDAMNDAGILEECGYSYAMGNAMDELKRKARFQTDTNDNDGVMKILRQIPSVQ